MTTKQVPLGVRVREDTREAVAAAAHDDARSIAAKVELILREWVIANGYLPGAAKPRPGTVGRLSRPKPDALAAEAAPVPTPREEPAEPVPAAVARERPQRRRYRDAPR